MAAGQRKAMASAKKGNSLRRQHPLFYTTAIMILIAELEPYSQALVVGLEEGQSDDGPDDAGEFVERSSVATGEDFPVL
ncbi:MAG: hypothetical protein ACRDTH_03170, partial [Pseudonocardiaceae bacterium]